MTFSDENDDEAEEVNCLSEVCSEYEEDISEENSHVTSDDADVSKYDKRSSSEDTKPRKKSRVKRIIDTDDDDDENDVAIDKVMNDSSNKAMSAEARNIEDMEQNASQYRLVDVSSKLDLEDYGGVLPELQKDCFLPCFDLGLGLSANDFELIACPVEVCVRIPLFLLLALLLIYLGRSSGNHAFSFKTINKFLEFVCSLLFKKLLS